MSTVRATVRALALAVGLAVTGLVAAPAAQAAPRAAVVLNPGDPIYSDGGVCVVGAYVTDGATAYILTAAACEQLGDTWYADETHNILVGTTAGGGHFPSESTLIALDPGIAPQHAFDSTDDAFVGESVCTLPGDGVSCGTVLALDVTVTTPDGTFLNLIDTNLCTEPGTASRGAPLFAGGTLLGIQPFDDGSCTSGGESFFQPITGILQADGVTLY